jgi:hypothetical protein
MSSVNPPMSTVTISEIAPIPYLFLTPETSKIPNIFMKATPVKLHTIRAIVTTHWDMNA